MDYPLSAIELDKTELNTQITKIDLLLNKLQFKIPSISQGLLLSNRLDDYLNYRDDWSPGEKDRSNFYVRKDLEHFYLNPHDWQKLELFLMRSSLENLNINFKKND